MWHQIIRCEIYIEIGATCQRFRFLHEVAGVKVFFLPVQSLRGMTISLKRPSHRYASSIVVISVLFIMILSVRIVILSGSNGIASNIEIDNSAEMDNEPTEDTSPFETIHIFQIGFNKCGTTSIYEFFMDNNIPSISYKIDQTNNNDFEEPQLSQIMFDRYHNKNIKYVLPFNGNKYIYYGDFGEYIINGSHDFDILCIETDANCVEWYKILLNQYPNNSVFILNIRNVNKWIKSRYTYPYPTFSTEFLKNTIEKYKISNDHEIIILNDWKLLWYQYICNLLQYFIDNKLMDKLLVFDVENDKIDKLIDFFASFNIKLKGEFRQHRKTKVRKKWQKKWQKICLEYPQFGYNASNELDNIQKQCNFNANMFTPIG